MSAQKSVYHHGFRCWWDPKRVEKALKSCAVVWVEGKEGEEIRHSTVAEQLAARAEQARLREPLPYAEIPGLRFDASASGLEATRAGRRLVMEAHQFAAELAA